MPNPNSKQPPGICKLDREAGNRNDPTSQEPAPTQPSVSLKFSRSLTPGGWCHGRGGFPVFHGRVRPHGTATINNLTCLRESTKTEVETTSMKNKNLLLSILSVTALTVGCDKPATTSQQLDKVQEKTTAVAQEMKDYTFAQKAEFTAAMRSQLAAINKDLDQLAVKVEKSSDAAKAEAKPKLQALRDQTANLTKQLDEAKNATESTWGDVKAGFRKGYSELKDGFQQARQWVSNKIAP